MKQPQPINDNLIPDFVTRVTSALETAGFEAFLVGGCVRDMILGKIPKDWDVTTNANPEQIQSLFEKTVYENEFGTVIVVQEIDDSVSRVTTPGDVSHVTESFKSNLPQRHIVEVTPYRLEGNYSDSRHPDKVTFSTRIEDDLKRRDFTINAMAYRPSKGQLIDLYKGQEDLEKGIIRTVDLPDERFKEDALRLMRTIRFACQLNFTVSHETIEAIQKQAHLHEKISSERIRDEFIKIVDSPNPMIGIGMLQKLGLLKYIVPELEEGIGCDQKGEHIYDVYEHCLHALGHASDKNFPFHVKLTALFHDIGKPRTRRWDGTKAGGKGKYTFYGHEVIGARMVTKILERLKFPKDISELIIKLVRYHMFFSDTETITLSAVRRTIVNIGREHIWELMQVRECDRAGMKKKEAPYRLRKYHAMIEEALRAPTSVGMLKIDGSRVMEILDEKPGPRVGMILNALLEEALENPDLNNEQHLEKRVLELGEMPLDALKLLAQAGKRAQAEKENAELEEIHKKHGIK